MGNHGSRTMRQVISTIEEHICLFRGNILWIDETEMLITVFLPSTTIIIIFLAASRVVTTIECLAMMANNGKEIVDRTFDQTVDCIRREIETPQRKIHAVVDFVAIENGNSLFSFSSHLPFKSFQMDDEVRGTADKRGPLRGANLAAFGAIPPLCFF